MQNDRTRTAPAKVRTLSRRMQRRLKIAHNGAALLARLAWGDAAPVAPAALAR